LPSGCILLPAGRSAMTVPFIAVTGRISVWARCWLQGWPPAA
jgi:hypothetical protein